MIGQSVVGQTVIGLAISSRWAIGQRRVNCRTIFGERSVKGLSIDFSFSLALVSNGKNEDGIISFCFKSRLSVNHVEN